MKIDTLKQYKYNLCMKHIEKTTKVSATTDILNKIKKFEVDTVYSIAQIAQKNDIVGESIFHG